MSEESTIYRNALPLKSMLLEYRLESVLGVGGFGMTYLGWDTNLEKHVAIKEYLPGEFAIRALDGSVVPVNTEHEYDYKWGLDSFIKEARTLAKFSHPNIVRVNRFFEANGTSYMVMDYEAGESLNQQLKRAPMPDEATLKSTVIPILDGLQAVHQAGFLHRDIKPSNVLIRENGTPVLIDFGSARLTGGGMSKNLTAIVTPGYAPLEQYTGDGNQGPWSDIYGLAGVIYRAVTGESPPDAVRRIKSDVVPASLSAARTRYGERFLKAIEWGMTLDEKLRPQSVAEWRELFTDGMPMTALDRSTPVITAPTQRSLSILPAMIETAANTGTQELPADAEAVTQRGAPNCVPTPRRWNWVGCGALLLVVAIAVFLYIKQHRMQGDPRQAAISQSGEIQDAAKSPGRTASPGKPATGGEDETQISPAVKKEFMAADRNGDGFLTPDDVRGRFPFIEKNFSRVDTDHDGRISLDEFWQLRQKQQAKRQGQ